MVQREKVCIGFTVEVRNALLETDLSPAALASVECPFDTALTTATAAELLAKCRQLGFTSAADLLRIALATLPSSNGVHVAHQNGTGRDPALAAIAPPT